MKKSAQNNVKQQIVTTLYKAEEPQSLEEISAITYQKAQETMNKLFNEFETVSMN